MLFVNME